MTKFCVGLFALVAIGFWSSFASGTVFIYEPFNYTAGQPLLGQSYDGSGTTVPATRPYQLAATTVTSTTANNIALNSLAGPPALPNSMYNALQLTGIGNRSGATDRLGISGDASTASDVTSGTVYYSFLLRVDALTGSNSNTGGLFFSLNNNNNLAQATDPTALPGRVQGRIDPTDGTKYNLEILGNTAATAADTTWSGPLNVGDTNFIVGAYNVTTRVAQMWINPSASTFGLSTVPAADKTSPAGAAVSAGIGSIVIRQSPAPYLTLDEIRVATSWSEVTPTLALYWDIDGTTAGAGGGGAPSGTWDNSVLNWSTSTAGDVNTLAWAGGSYTAVFTAGDSSTGGANSPYTVNVAGTQTAFGLTFEDGTPTLTGGTISLTGGTITTNGGVTAMIGSVIGGNTSLSLIKQGTGTATVHLTGNETYTGSTTIGSSVSLTVGDGSTSGALPVVSAVTNNGELVFSRSDTVTQGTNFDSTGAGMSGSGTLTQAGSGNLVLAVANTYSGATSATAGTLTIKNTMAVQNSVVVTDAGGSVVFDPTLAGQNVTVGGLSSASTAYTAPSNMSLTVNAVSANTTYAPAITGTGTLTKKGTFAQTLSGTNTFNGATSINVGTLQYTQKAAMPASSAITVNGQADWTVTPGTSTNFTGGILSVYTDDGSSGTVWSNTGSGAGTITGLINGTGGQGNSIVWNNGSSLGIHIEPGLGDPTAGIAYSGTIGNFHTILAGDFNHDNVVDDGDYVIWRKGGSPSPNSPGDYNAWRGNFGATGSGGTTNNVGVLKRGYGTLTLSGANTYSGQLKVNDEGGILRLTSVQINAGQSMALPAVYIGAATSTTSTVLKVLTNNALPANSLIRFGTGSTGGFTPALRLHEEDPPNTSIATIPVQSFNQTVRGFSGGNGQVQIGAGTLTIDTPVGESYSFTGRYITNYDALGGTGQHGTLIKTGAGRQDFDFFDSPNPGLIKGDFILQQGTVGIGNAQIFGLNNQVQDLSSTQLPWPRLTINGGALVNTSGASLSMTVPNLFIGGSFTFDVVGNFNSQFSGGTNHTLTTLTASPTITVTAGSGTGVLILPWKVQDDGTARGITKAGPGVLTLGSQENSYRGDTTIQEGSVRLSTSAISGTGIVPVIGNQTTPGRLVLAGGRLEMNSNPGTVFAPEFSGNPYAVPSSRTNIENNPIHVEAPNDTSSIAFIATPADPLSAGDIYFVFQTNSFDWTSGKLTFLHNGNVNSAGNTFRPTFTGNFNYAGPVAISNNTANAGKTVLQSANTSGTQTWSGDIAGTGSFLRDGAGGTTLLSGNNGYLGDTLVNGGILSITHPYLADAADVRLSDLTDPNAKLNLNFTGTDTIDQLFIDNSSQPTGTWGAPFSGAQHESPLISGTGFLLVSTPGSGSNLTNDTSAVPEPAALSLVLLAIGPAMALRRRKR